MDDYEHDVTPIDSLPSFNGMQDDGYGTTILPDEQDARTRKYIRNNHAVPIESGMQSRHTASHRNSMDAYGLQEQYFANQRQQRSPLLKETSYVSEPDYDDYHRHQDMGHRLYCGDVVEHVRSCPICSRYFSNDKTIYIILIIALSVACVLLIKKLLDCAATGGFSRAPPAAS